MQILIDIKELQEYQSKVSAWAQARAMEVAKAVPSQYDMSSDRFYRNPDHLQSAYNKAIKETPLPLLLPSA